MSLAVLPTLLTFSAGPSPPKEGLFDCTVTKAGAIEMHTRPGSKTLPCAAHLRNSAPCNFS